MKRQAGGLIELLLAFLILSVVVAYAMQTTLLQMKQQNKNSKTTVSGAKVDKPAANVNINQVQEAVLKIEIAKKLKMEEELQFINTQPR